MASHGAKLLLCDLNTKGLHETVAACARSEDHIASVLDVSSFAAVNEYVRSIEHVDFVFNCAGVYEEVDASKQVEALTTFCSTGVNPTAYELTDTSMLFHGLTSPNFLRWLTCSGNR